jgi:prevent-host-death family protein
VLSELAEQRTPLVITQNGEAKAVLQDVASFEQTQETLALLKILALGNQDVEASRVVGVEDVVARLCTKRVIPRVSPRVTPHASGNTKSLTRARAKTSKQ